MDAFRAQCPIGSVVMITEALYGRIQRNRCIRSDNNLGCVTDVISHLDKLCSGREQCDLPQVVFDLMPYNPCSDDSTPYLRTAYACVPGDNLVFCL